MNVKTNYINIDRWKVTVPTTDGVATAKDVANAINNAGWKANADATGTGIKNWNSKCKTS